MAGKLNRWLVKLDDKTVCIYADQKDNALYCKTFGANGWNERELIIGNTSGNISVSIGEDNNLYIFCTDLKGNIVLCVNTRGKWINNIIQENKTQSIHEIYFHVCMTNDGMDMIYNFPESLEKNYGLYYRQASRGARWGDPVKIDNLSPFYNAPFIVQKVAKQHYVVFYQTKKHETNIVYREISFEAKKWSDCHNIFKSGYTCRDVSFLTTNNAVHVLVIVQGMFSFQMLYLKKQGGEFSKPSLLYEGQRIDNCLVQILEGTVFCTFFVGGQMYICKSENMGESFSRPVKYKYSYDINLIKTVFVYDNLIDGDKAFLNYVYTEEDNIGSIALVTDFYPNILIPKPKYVPEPTPQPQPTNPPIENNYDSSYGFSFPSMQNSGSDKFVQSTGPTVSSNDLEFLKSQVLYLTRQMEKKEHQISNLMNQIKEKDRLAANTDASWKEKYTQIVNESKSTIADLENKLINFKDSYSSILDEYEFDIACDNSEPIIPDDYKEIIESVFENEEYVDEN